MKPLIAIAALSTMLFSFKSNAQKADIESFATQHGTVTVECICHGSLAISFDGYLIMVDPVAEMDGRKIDCTKFGKADAIFVTHHHYDHMDPKAISQLSDGHTAIFANGTACEQLGTGTALALGDKGILNDKISYETTAAYNTTPDHLKFHPKGIGNGYIFEIDGLRIYVAGDTEFIPEMKELERIDVAFLPVNQPYTMTVEQATEAARAISPKIFVPYHLTDTKIEAIKKALDGSDIEVRLHESLR